MSASATTTWVGTRVVVGVLPSGLADMPAGPRLAVLVASVDRRLCNGFELEELVRARRKLIGWLEAECLSDVNELAHAAPGMPEEPAQRSVELDSMTQVVLEALLGWSGYHADWYLTLATTLPRLPRVRAALASGRLELAEVRILVDRITDAKPHLWGAIEDAIFPKVLELRGGLLRAKVEAEVVKADPEAATKRHRAARAGRNVAIWPAVDGVADLAIRGLSADQAAEAYGYVDAIARAVKSSGDPRNLSQLRADVAYSLLAGTADITGCSAPTAGDDHADQDQPPAETEDDEPEQDEPEQCPAGGSARQGQADTEQLEDESPAQNDVRPETNTEPAQSDTDQDGKGQCAVHRFPDHDLHDSWCECGDCAPAPVPSCSVCGAAAMHGVPVHDTAAHHAAGKNAADRYAAGQNSTECDAPAEDSATADSDAPPAKPSASGQIPRQNRPLDETADPPEQPVPPDPPPDNSTPPAEPPPWSSTQPSWGPIRTRAKIQLNVPLTTLMGLSTRPGELGGWGPVITEVAERLVANNLTNPEARFSVGVSHPVTGRLLHLHPLPARFLRGLQAELVHARDQRCVWTTCRRPAATCHLDHNTEYADGGETGVDNIAPLCPRHHKAKTERDWKLKQTGPGEHTLTDPFGRSYSSGAPSLTDPVVPVEPATATAGARPADDDLPPF
ncbi:HNH endonuclease [Actinopolymorpha sp. NPDC004070]|uniref:HNH endonuclease signature motif containing protein n=1 Tax=Actinopolymorpha sp. NPDC004070 TaxID=3154548 RepID=UPI0033A818AF